MLRFTFNFALALPSSSPRPYECVHEDLLFVSPYTPMQVRKGRLTDGLMTNRYKLNFLESNGHEVTSASAYLRRTLVVGAVTRSGPAAMSRKRSSDHVTLNVPPRDSVENAIANRVSHRQLRPQETPRRNTP